MIFLDAGVTASTRVALHTERHPIASTTRLFHAITANSGRRKIQKVSTVEVPGGPRAAALVLARRVSGAAPRVSPQILAPRTT